MVVTVKRHELYLAMTARQSMKHALRSRIIVDSGAEKSICCDQTKLTNARTVNHDFKVVTADNSPHRASIMGTLHARDKDGRVLKIENVYYVPSFNYNLFSVIDYIDVNKHSLGVHDNESFHILKPKPDHEKTGDTTSECLSNYNVVARATLESSQDLLCFDLVDANEAPQLNNNNHTKTLLASNSSTLRIFKSHTDDETFLDSLSAYHYDGWPYTNCNEPNPGHRGNSPDTIQKSSIDYFALVTTRAMRMLEGRNSSSTEERGNEHSSSALENVSRPNTTDEQRESAASSSQSESKQIEKDSAERSRSASRRKGPEMDLLRFNNLQKTAIMLHHKLGHKSWSSILRALDPKAEHVLEIPIDADRSELINYIKSIKGEYMLTDTLPCSVCGAARATRIKFTSSNIKLTEPLEHVHADLNGPHTVDTPDQLYDVLGVQKYVSVIVDRYSNMIWVKAVPNKSAAISHFLEWLPSAESQSKKVLRAVTTDGGKEYLTNEHRAFLKGRSVALNTTTPHTPQHNNPAERANRTIWETARAILFHAKLPNGFWPFAVEHAAYLHNITVSASRGKTPYELFTGHKPSYKNLHVFGCDVLVLENQSTRQRLTFDKHAVNGVFLGYHANKISGKVLFLPATNNFITRRDVYFYDSSFQHGIRRKDDEVNGGTDQSTAYDIAEAQRAYDDLFLLPDATNDEDIVSDDDDDDDDDCQSNDKESLDNSELSPAANNSKSQQKKRGRPFGSKNKPKQHDDTHVDPVVKRPVGRPRLQPAISVEPRASLRSRKRATTPGLLNYDDMHPGDQAEMFGVHPAFMVLSSLDLEGSVNSEVLALAIQALTFDPEPQSYDEAMSSNEKKQWAAATDAELDAVLKRGTWSHVERSSLPKGANVLTAKWVFKRKRDAEGNIKRYKARVVVRGHRQRYGVDYTETFAPTIKYKSLRLSQAIAASIGYNVHQIDITNAFLYSDVKEDVYLQFPQGYNPKGIDKTKHLLKLNKSLYGIKQAPKGWYDTCSDECKNKLKLSACVHDPCVLVKESATKRLIFTTIYVDDITFGFSTHDRNEAEQCKTLLKQRFELTDTGEATHLLGMRIQRDKDSIGFYNMRIDVEAHIIKLLSMVKGEINEHLHKTPLPSGARVTKNDSPQNDVDRNAASNRTNLKSIEFPQAVGILLYISLAARPDISFAVQQLCTVTANPGIKHWEALEHVLRYLSGTPKRALNLNRKHNDALLSTYEPIIEAYSDSDFANDTDTRRSISGYVIFVDNNIVSWGSKKQNSVALSTAEAEFMALTECAKEVLWLRYLIEEMIGRPLTQPTTIKCDNRAAMFSSEDDSQHGLMKHIDYRVHCIKDWVKRKLVKVVPVDTRDNIADMFTKALPHDSFTRHCMRFMVDPK